MPEVNTPEGYSPGLEGVIAGLSAISKVDPEGDELIYYGYKVSELCEKSSFEEVTYLLLHGGLPNRKAFENFNREFIRNRELPKDVLELISKIPPKTHYMDVLRSAISWLAHYDPRCDDNSKEAEIAKSNSLTSKTTALIAARVRALRGEKPLAPNLELSHAANFLYMVHGKIPEVSEALALDRSLICYAEHGFNASTFTARVCASTLSDLHSCVVGAIGSLKGPLHGGANEQAMYMLLEIGEPSRAKAWIQSALAQKKKIMGFGHRVYKKKDSRAPIIKKLGWELARQKGITKWHEMQDIIERILWDEKKLFPNVDFPAATLYYLLGLPIEADTPLFVAARMAGWCAHVVEERLSAKLIRPECHYKGPKPRAYVPWEER